MSPIRLAVAGASGRMGRVLIRLIHEAPDLALAGALESPASAHLGTDAGDLAGTGSLDCAITDDLPTALAACDGLIDFTAPAGTLAALDHTLHAGVCHIIGTTGFTDVEQSRIEAAAHRIPIVKAGNFSLGVAVLCTLVERAARVLGPDFDIEIAEMHHRHKQDAPSGTALMIGEAAARGRNTALKDARLPAREGITGARAPGGIGFAALRGGSVIGEHTALLAGPAERLALTHIAEDRSLFARGALAAARWAHGRAPGLYGMSDVLGDAI